MANCDVASILVDTIQLSIPPVSGDISDLEPVSVLSDEQVLVLTELQMEPEQDARLSELLDRQQSGTLRYFQLKKHPKVGAQGLVPLQIYK